MLRKPRIKSFLTIFPIDAGMWGLRGGYDELSRLRLRNERAIQTFGRVLPYLDGTRDVESLLARVVDEGVNAEDALQLLVRLEEASLLEEGDPCGMSQQELARHRSQLAFFSRYGNAGGATHQATLRRSTVCVVGEGDLASCLRRQLGRSGFGRVLSLPLERSPDLGTSGESDQGHAERAAVQQREAIELDPVSAAAEAAGALNPLAQLFFVPQENHDPLLLEAIDAFSQRFGATWMLLRALESHEGWVGPLFVPGETANYRSLEARFSANVPFFAEHQAFERHLRVEVTGSATCGGLHSFFELLSAIAVVEGINHITGIRVSALVSRFLTVNLLNWEIEAHEVLSLPRLGLESVNGPVPLPWKEMPHDVTDAQRENELRMRRG